MDPLTEKLLQRAWNADSLRRQKAAIKRVVNSLRKQVSELGPLLDDDEKAALEHAARVLDRWTGKAERAFEAKHQTEQAEAARRQQRLRDALQALRTRYAGDAPEEQVRRTGAMTGQGAYPEDFVDWLRREMALLDSRARKYPGTDAGKALRNALQHRFDEAMHAIADEVAYRTEPLSDLLPPVIARIDDAMAENEAETNELIAETRAFLVRHQLVQANKPRPHDDR